MVGYKEEAQSDEDVEKCKFFFFQAEDGIRAFCLARGLGGVYERQDQ